MQFFITWFFVYPAVAMTSWTLATLAVAWTFKLNRELPGIIAIHPMMMIMNPKDTVMYQRPTLVMALIHLIIGFIPVISNLVLAFVLYVTIAHAVEQLWEWIQRFRGDKPQR